MRHGDTELRESAVPVILEWLRDEDADSRGRAILLCSKNRLNIEEAVPDLMAVLDRLPENQQQLDETRSAMHALRGFAPEGLAEKLLAIAANDEAPPETCAPRPSTR